MVNTQPEYIYTVVIAQSVCIQGGNMSAVILSLSITIHCGYVCGFIQPEYIHWLCVWFY